MTTPTTTAILKVFETFRMAPTAYDQYESVGRQILAERISKFVSEGKTIEFIMLGFPFKSTNRRDKVIGELPDLGEELTLKNFARFNEEISRVYSAGVNVGIASDGFVFNDLLGVSDKIVDQYAEISHDLGRVAPMSWYSLRDFYESELSSSREKVMNQFAPTPEKLEQEILMNPDVNILYRGMTRFMMEELADKGYPSGNQLQKAAKKLTREMMMRNEAWSNLVKKEFSHKIRLSMHPSVNNGAKFSFKLIPGERTHHSAWHSAVFMDGDEVVTIHKKDAEAQGLRLILKDGRPYSYER